MKQQLTRIRKKHVVSGVFFAGTISLMYAGIASLFTPIRYEGMPLEQAQNSAFAAEQEKIPEPPAMVHIEIPHAVKAAYMSSCVASTPSFRDHVIGIANKTEINSLVIDIKDSSGILSYEPDDRSLRQEDDGKERCDIENIRALIKRLHDDNIYTIGRIAVFQDPYFVKMHPELAVQSKKTGKAWKDRKGITWIDAGSQEMWDYTIAIAKDAYSQGFDEINFDYIRFPSDGNIQDMAFPVSSTTPKTVVMRSFFEYLSREMKTAGIPTSADVFGMTTTVEDDLNIGQELSAALENFDYVAPMVYPSHYPKGFNGWSNPNAHPYELIQFVMGTAVSRANEMGSVSLKLRPWLQDFSIGYPEYGKAEVEAQIKALYDVGLTSWMLWDPSNKYAGGALLPE